MEQRLDLLADLFRDQEHWKAMLILLPDFGVVQYQDEMELPALSINWRPSVKWITCILSLALIRPRTATALVTSKTRQHAGLLRPACRFGALRFTCVDHRFSGPAFWPRSLRRLAQMGNMLANW